MRCSKIAFENYILCIVKDSRVHATAEFAGNTFIIHSRTYPTLKNIQLCRKGVLREDGRFKILTKHFMLHVCV